VIYFTFPAYLSSSSQKRDFDGKGLNLGQQQFHQRSLHQGFDSSRRRHRKKIEIKDETKKWYKNAFPEPRTAINAF
jgi:hypothetical protein